MFYESNESMSHESMRQQVGSAVFHKKQMDNEYRVIFLPNNGKSRSMEDKSRQKLLRLDTTKQWHGGGGGGKWEG